METRDHSTNGGRKCLISLSSLPLAQGHTILFIEAIMRFVRAALLAPVVIVISGFGAGPGSTASPAAQHAAEVVVRLDRFLGTIDPLLWGHFTEETLTSWEGGVSSEMLVDRKFSIPEERQPGVPLLSGTGGGWEPIEFASNATLVQDDRRPIRAPSVRTGDRRQWQILLRAQAVGLP